MAEEPRKDFFISYNGADKAWAEWIAWELEAAGYSTIIQAWDFRPGRNFVVEMQQAAATAIRTIAVLSPDYLTAQFTQPEWAAAFAQDPAGEKGLLVPVRVAKVTLEGLWGQIIYIDLLGLDEAAANDALIAGIEERRAKPSAAPKFPGGARSPDSPRFPGSVPTIWNVPHPRNPNFTGREQILEDLEAALASGRAAALTQAALHGLGGIGKTQLALEYAYRHAWEYDLVWWVRSESAAALAADYAALAGPLGLPEKEAPEQEVAVAAVRQLLGNLRNWLLVFDNANEPKDLKKFLPLGGSGQILVTSRYAAWRGTARPLEVKVWPREEAVAYLLRRTGQQDEAAAGELARELGDLPLALEQAAAYIDECGDTLAHYLELFRSRRLELLQRGQSSQEYPNTVATTWDLSFAKIKQESPAAAELLNLCAFLAPDDIPKEMLIQGAEHLPPGLAGAVADPLALNEALKALRRYSLMEVGTDSLAVHRLVQAVVRDRLDDQGQKEWAVAAVNILNQFLSSGVETNVEIWPWYSRLLPHAQATAINTVNSGVILPALGRVLNQVGLYLQVRAEFIESRKAIGKAITIYEKTFGPEHPNVATAVNNLGSVLRAQGNISEARKLFERALGIYEKVHGLNHPLISNFLNNLGGVLQDQGDLLGAKVHYERALVIAENAYGPNHTLVSKILNNLGCALFKMGNLTEAKEYFKRALAIDEALYGVYHPEVARELNNFGSVLWAQGDLSGAKVNYERALSIVETVYGQMHPYVATTANNLGSVLLNLGEHAKAKAHYERALAIDEAAYGLVHPEVATDLNNLGNVLHYMGDLAGAQAHYERALGIFRRFLGDDHPHTQLVAKSLAILLDLLRKKQ